MKRQRSTTRTRYKPMGNEKGRNKNEEQDAEQDTEKEHDNREGNEKDTGKEQATGTRKGNGAWHPQRKQPGAKQYNKEHDTT
jgi:hypothetical protein